MMDIFNFIANHRRIILCVILFISGFIVSNTGDNNDNKSLVKFRLSAIVFLLFSVFSVLTEINGNGKNEINKKQGEKYELRS